jgi:hypothetical protein
MEGTPLADQEKGAALYSAFRVSKMFGNVTGNIWPYEPDIWPPAEPEDLDTKAAPFRMHHYFRVRDESEMKQSLANGFPVTISIPYYHQWRSTEGGVIQFPGQNETAIGMHAMAIVGYRDDHQYFHFRNSWGAKWGDNGYGWLPYGYFDQYGVEAIAGSAFTTQYVRQPSKEAGYGILKREWGLNTPIRTSMHGVTIFDTYHEQEVAWAFAFEEGKSLDVEEYFVSPLYRKRGFVRELLKSLNQLSLKIDKPLRYWLPHIDSVMLGQNIHDLAWIFNLRVERSPVKWAAKMLIPKP